MLKWYFIIVFLIFSESTFSAPAPPKSKLPVRHLIRTDSSKLSARHFNADSLNIYRKDPAFNYRTTHAGVTWWDRFWDWVWLQWTNFWDWVGELLQKLFGRTGMGHNAASVFKFIITGMFTFMVLYIILKLLGIDFLALFRKKKESGALPYTEFVENIHDIDFDEAIESALAVKNYRLAVRLLYLRSLKQLSDNNLIHWRIDKTNTAYLNELTNEDHRQRFALITRQFEYIWYGDLPIDGTSFQNVNAIFQEFKRGLL